MATRSPADLLRTARARARLSQRALARRAGTAQSVVARIENGTASPTWETLARLIETAGFELEVSIGLRTAETSRMLNDVPRILRLTPEQRLTELRNVSRFVTEAKRTSRRSRT